MGIKVKYLAFFCEALEAAEIFPRYSDDQLIMSYAEYKMAELGNQHMKHHSDPGLVKYDPNMCKTGKEYFTKLGFDHTSFDINGQDGAIPIDLGLPIPGEFKNKFDIVTNFGTTEHVIRQQQVFKNIHKMLKVGGIVIHIVPLAYGPLKDHGVHQYDFSFFTALCRLYTYEILLPAEERKTVPGCITSCLRKL